MSIIPTNILRILLAKGPAQKVYNGEKILYTEMTADISAPL